MSKWGTVKIKEVAVVKNGSTPSTKDDTNYNGNIVWITPNDLSKQQKKYVSKGERNITQSGYNSCSTTLLPKGSILLSSRAPIGLLAIAGVELCTNQGFKNLVLKPNIDSDFLYYYLKTKINEIENIGTGTTFKEVSKSALEGFNILIPKNITQQRNIASVLSSLDDKIELNNRINAELEAMEKTLYDYWFVQFDFPDANGKPYKSSGGKMVYNQELKREIPEGWEVGKLADWIASDKSGDWGKEQKEGNYKLKVSCIRGADINGLNGKGELNPPKRFILEKNNSKILNPYDLIIEISGGSPTQSTGRMAYITPETLMRFENPLICSNFCKAISLRNYKYLYNFSFLWDMLYNNKVFFGFEGKTSGIKNFLFESFVNSYWSVIPDEEIVLGFYRLMQNIEKKKQKLLAENQQLASLRDWLLPMLMNGQVGFKEEYQEQPQVVNVVAEVKVEYKRHTQQDQRFELWLSNQGLAARGEIDKSTLREIFNVMDEEEYGK